MTIQTAHPTHAEPGTTGQSAPWSAPFATGTPYRTSP